MTTSGADPSATLTAPDLVENAQTPAVGGTSVRWQRRLVRALLVADTILVVAAVAGALLALAGRHLHVPALDGVLAAVLVPGWLLALASVGAYELRFLGTGAEEFKRVGNATLALTALVGAGAFLFGLPVTRLFLGVAVPGAGALLLVGRYAARVQLHRLRDRGRAQHRVVAVGTATEVEHLLAVADEEPASGWSIVGACIVGEGAEDDTDVPFLSTSTSVEDVARAAAAVDADTIAVLHPGALGRGGIRRLAWRLEGTDAHLLLSPALTDIAGPRVTVRPIVGLPLLHLEQPAFSGFRQVVKRFFDLVAGGLLTLVALLVIGVAAVAIKIDSRGGVFYRQRRVGLNGDEFTCLKLRSMHRDADQRLADLEQHNERREGLLFKMKQDPRVTRVGRILRRTSLDELPQLFNVLRGDMSLVGPRPPLPSEVARYSGDVHRRLLVKPGMTGLWQVSGRSDLTWEESVRLDLYYVENWSPLLDLSILAKTAVAVVKGSGAY